MKAWLVSSKVCAMILRVTSLPSADITARSRVNRAPPPARSLPEVKAGAT
ncbi:hypothetical protein ACVWW2_004007 [Bradyrhizobium sp. LM4.3]